MRLFKVTSSPIACLSAGWLLAVFTGAADLPAADFAGAPSPHPVALRVESFTVPPSSQPLVYVDVKNLQAVPYRGSVAMKVPDGWRLVPSQRRIELKPGQSGRVSFTLEQGVSLKSNCYPVQVAATGAGTTVLRKQNVVCASAPYFKPTIDGDPGEWKDAIPVTFTTEGKKTVVSTYWNRRQFSILVAVEEENLIEYRGQNTPDGPGPDGFDAVQVAVAPQDAKTPTRLDGEATRFEFLCVSTGKGVSTAKEVSTGKQTAGRCFQLASPGMKLAEAAKSRRLEPLRYEQATVAVGRTGTTTYYEIGISLSPMRNQIRPSEGREFRFSVLVHDPDGTGIRDLGRAAGLWPWQRNPLAWSRFVGAKWGQQPPLDSKLEWGMCSSTY